MSSKQEKTNVQSTTQKKQLSPSNSTATTPIATPNTSPSKKQLPQATSYASIPQPPTIPMANTQPAPSSYSSMYAAAGSAPQTTFISVPTPVGTIQVPLLPPTSAQTPSPYYAPYGMPFMMPYMGYNGAYPMMMPGMKKKKKKRTAKKQQVIVVEEEEQQAEVQASPEDQPASEQQQQDQQHYLVATSEDAFLDAEFALIEEGSLEIVVEEQIVEKRGVKRNMEEVMDEILSNERAAKRMRQSSSDEDEDDNLQDLDNIVVLDTGFLEGAAAVAVYDDEDEGETQDQDDVGFVERYSVAATFSFGMDEAF